MQKNVTKNVKRIMALTLSLFLTLPHFTGGRTLYAEVNDSNKQTNIISSNISDNQMNVGLPVILGGTFKTVNSDESGNSTDTDIIETETVEDQVDEVTDETETVDVVETESPEVVETEEPSSELIEEPLVSENKAVRALSTGTVGTVEWSFDDTTGVLTFGGGTFPDNYDWQDLINPIDRSTVSKVVFEEPVIAGNSLKNMFLNMTNLTEIVNLNLLNTGNTTNMTSIFQSCKNLTTIDLSSFDTSAVTNMYGMFYGCTNIKTLDVSNFDTSSVTDFAYMFRECTSLESVDVSNWDVSKATTMFYMFASCRKLVELDVSKWDVSSCTNINSLFYGCTLLTKLDVSKWDVSNCTRLDGVFSGCMNLTELDVSQWDVSKCTSFTSLFNSCSLLKTLDISNWNTMNVKSMQSMFLNCYELTNIDLSQWNTSNLTSLKDTFTNCKSLTELDLNGWDTSNVTNMDSTFKMCSKLSDLNVSTWDTSNVTNMAWLFNNCVSLYKLDLTNWDISKANTDHMLFLAKFRELTLGDKFKNKESTYLPAPSNTNGYDGTWVYVPTGAIVTHDELKAYGSTESTLTPGTYIWREVQYEIVFDMNFEGGSETAPAAQMYDYNVLVEKPADPVRTGYTLDKWTSDAQGETTWNFAVNKMPANNLTLYAQWTPSTDTAYKIEHYQEQLDGTFGIKETENLTGTTATTVEATAKTFEGYTHDATNTNNVATGTIAADGSLVLKVYYTLNTYTVTFNYNNGAPSTSEDLKFGADINKPTDPEKAGYTFTGWTPAVDTTMPANDVTYTATYEESTDTAYKVEYHVEQLDGTFEVKETENLTGTTGAEVVATIKTFEGYSHDAANVNNVASGTIVADGSLVLKSYYTLNTYTVKFRDRDGIIFSSTDLKFGEKIIAPAYPPIAGYAFTGWAPKLDETMPANDVMYTARYGQLRYVLTFRDYDRRIISDNSYYFGTPISAPADPIRPGYTFTGWSPEVAATMPMNPVTHFAQYTANTDTAYKVEHYQEQLDGTYVCVETENLTGTTDTTVDATIKTFEGYMQDAANADSVPTGTIAGDGSLVMKVFYSRNTYTVTYKDHDDTVLAEFTGKYEETYTIPEVPTRPAYQFTDWIEIQNTRTVNQRSVHGIIPSRDVVYTARYTPIEEPKTETVKPLTDDGGPFITDECGTITDRWGNVMYKPSTCLASTTYKVPNTGVK